MCKYPFGSYQGSEHRIVLRSTNNWHYFRSLGENGSVPASTAPISFPKYLRKEGSTHVVVFSTNQHKCSANEWNMFQVYRGGWGGEEMYLETSSKPVIFRRKNLKLWSEKTSTSSRKSKLGRKEPHIGVEIFLNIVKKSQVAGKI